jgi:hypothetical protein
VKYLLICLLLSFGSFASAQAGNEAPAPASTALFPVSSSTTSQPPANQAFGIQSIHSVIEAAPPMSIAFVEHERKQQVVTGKFVAFALFAFAATVGDVESTEYGTSHGASEGNPLVGAHPSRGLLYGISLPVSTGMALWSYKLKRTAPHSARWMIPLCVTIGIHTGAAANNLIRANP